MAFEKPLISVTQTPADSGMAELQALLAQQAAAAAELRQSMMALSESSAKAGSSLGGLTKGLSGWGVAAHAVGTGINVMSAQFMEGAAKLRIAQGRLSEGFAMQAQNMGHGLTMLSAIPFIGGPMAKGIQERWNENTGIGRQVEISQTMENAFRNLRGSRDVAAVEYGGGQLAAKYRYDPEQLAYQQELLGIRVKHEQPLEAEHATLLKLSMEASKAKMEWQNSFEWTIAGGAGSALKVKADNAKAEYDRAYNIMAPGLQEKGRLIEGLQKQAEETYRANFYGGMQTTSYADWRSSGVSPMQLGGFEQDAAVTGINLTNSLLTEIKQIIGGPGVRP